MMIHCLLVIFFAWFSGLGNAAGIKDPAYDELEGFDLADALVRDGKLDSARRELRDLKKSDRYWLVLGNLEMAAENWPAAIASYQKSGSSPKRELFLGRAYFRKKEFLKCAEHFGVSQSLWFDNDNDVLAKAECEFKEGRHAAAWTTLDFARKRRDSFPLLRQQVALKIELNLLNQALVTALKGVASRSTSDLLSLAELFHNKKASAAALTLIEVARTRNPLNIDANLSAAQVYYQSGDLRAAVECFERAAQVDAKYSYHAAEIHRQLGNRQRAMYYAQLIPQEKERLRARMALYVEAGQYPMIASLESVISRSELSDDDEMKYAMAYALLRQGNLEKPLKHLSRILKPELLEKAALLRKATLDCQAGTCQL